MRALLAASVALALGVIIGRASARDEQRRHEADAIVRAASILTEHRGN